MAKVTQFCIGLDNEPGVLAKLCATLKRAKVNIDAISVVDNVDCAWVRVVAAPAALAREALTKAKYEFCVRRVLSLPAGNRPGELEDIATKLAKAKVNIDYVYGSAAGEKAVLIIGVTDVDTAAKALAG
jgi:hypothetical protein